MGYLHLIEMVGDDQKERIDEMLVEVDLEEIPAGRERNREYRRREARRRGIDQGGALHAMRNTQQAGAPGARRARRV